MKKLFLCVALFTSFCVFGSTVTGPVGDISGGVFNPVIEFWPLSTPYNSGQTNIVGPPISRKVINGNFSQSLLAGAYRVKFPPTTNSFIIYVPNDTETYSLSTLSSNVPSISGIATTQILTTNNLKNYVLKGDNMTFVTNANGSLTISSSGGGTSGALTNNDTRQLTFTDRLTLGSAATDGRIILTDGDTKSYQATVGSDGWLFSESVETLQGFIGNGSNLTDISGASITSGTITSNKLDATAYVAFKNDVTAAGLAAGSYALPYSTNVIFVAKNGSNSTGDGSYNRPLLTISNAVSRAVAGQTVHVMPGVYVENDLAKDGISLVGELNADIFYTQTTTNDAGQGVIDDRGKGPVVMKLDWPGTISFAGYSNVAAHYDIVEDPGVFYCNPNTVGTIVQTNPASKITGRTGTLSGSKWANDGTMNCLNLGRGSADLTITTITNLYDGQDHTVGSGVFTALSSAIYTEGADAVLNVKTIAARLYAWLWVEPGQNTNDVFINSERIFGNLYGDAKGSNLTYRGWLKAVELDASYSYNVGVPISIYGGGRWYFDVLKVKAKTGKACLDTYPVPFIGGATSNAQIWVTSQKFSSDANFIELNGSGTAWVSVQDYESLASGTANGIRTTAGGVLIPDHSMSGLTNITAAATSKVIQFPRAMPGTNYTVTLSHSFNPVAIPSITSQNRSNFTISYSAGVTTGGNIYWQAKQNIQ